MRYGSVCSGIEAATVAWEPLGWQAAWFAEIDTFPAAVLQHHYPSVPNLGDMTALPQRILSGEVEAPDVLAGGTPCQAFSVAGLRASMQDARGQLTITFLEIANAIDTVRAILGKQPCIIVWENVPGALSTADNAFGCLLGGIVGESEDLQPTGRKWTNAGLVHGPERQAAWRILDAQFFGVPQRRRRIFLVSSARTDIDCAKILFEQKSVLGNTSPGKGSQEETSSASAQRIGTAGAARVAKCLTTRTGQAYDFETEDFVVHGTQDPCTSDKAFALGRNNGQENVVAIAGNILGRAVKNGGNGVGDDESGKCYTLTTQDRHAVAYSIQSAAIGRDGTNDQVRSLYMKNVTPTLTCADRHAVAFRACGQDGFSPAAVSPPILASGGVGSGVPSIQSGYMVRRLMPIECERLQGFPDNYTQVPWRGKEAADCPDAGRYKALGNSMAVPVMRWIGQQINEAASQAA